MTDYISREAAIKAAQDGADEWDGGFNRNRDAYIECAIDQIPAADVVEVRHARPVKFYSDPYTDRLFTTCSACDGKIGPRDKWCKHCGARMDGGATPDD